MKEGLAELTTAVLACFWSYKLIGDYMETIRERWSSPSTAGGQVPM